MQECPPRFAAPLAEACGAEAHRVLTSRNSLSPLRTFIARRNPDLIASGEGGSNLTLVRWQRIGAGLWSGGSWRFTRDRRSGRAMAFTRADLGEGTSLCIANLHATNDRPDLATADVLRAAEAATEWAGDSPLLFGGDLNLRPAEDPGAFEALRERFGLDGPTHPRAIDHLLTRNLEIADAPSPWPPERRELPRDSLRLRLSDHAPVAGSLQNG